MAQVYLDHVYNVIDIKRPVALKDTKLHVFTLFFSEIEHECLVGSCGICNLLSFIISFKSGGGGVGVEQQI